MGWAGEQRTADVPNGGSETASDEQLEICDIWQHTKTLGVTDRMVVVLLRLTPRRKVLLETLTVTQLVSKPVPVYTELSKSLCAHDDYSTKNTQKYF
jgi:hypothetical protein